MYQVYKDGKPVGVPFDCKQAADDYAKAIGGTVKETQVQGQQNTQERLTQ